MAVSHGGGVFTSRTLGRGTDEARALTPLNESVIQTLGLRDGVTHIEFLRALDPGQTGGAPWLFLEAAARVGGANLSDMIEYATGVNLWEQWARIEVARARGEVFLAPAARNDNAGILVCLARMEHPDMAAYNDPEIRWRMDKPYHAGLIVVSPNSARVASLLQSYATRFAADFLTSAKPMETGRMV